MKKRLFLAFAMLMTFCLHANADADVCDFIKDGIFYKIQSDGSVHVWYEDATSWDPCYTQECYVIPETVTYEGTTYTVTGIGHTAFYGCTNVNYVSLPKTIKNIDDRAFEGCTSLEYIICYATAPPTLSSSAFTGLFDKVKLWVPSSALDTYKAKTGWKSFSNIDSIENLEAYAVYDSDSKTLTFYYDDLKNTANRIGTKYDLNEGNNTPRWIDYDNPKEIKKVKFHSSFQNARPTSTYDWFYCQYTLTEIEGLGFLNTSMVENMDELFLGCSSLTTLDLSTFDTSRVKSMISMFNGCTNLGSLNLLGWDTSIVTNMRDMFCNCSSLATLNLSTFDTNNVIDMQEMFYNCNHLESLILGNSFSTSNVTNMGSMFFRCRSLGSLNVSTFNTTNVTDMSNMFYLCSSLRSLDVSSFNTSNVTNMCYMFYSCSGLISLDISSFNTSNMTNMSGMFNACESLKTIVVGENWTTENVTESSYMFSRCTSIKGGAGTVYDADHIDKEYAHIDEGSDNPGYFSTRPSGYAVYTSSNQTLTFYNDGNMGESYYELTIDGEVPEWLSNSNMKNVTTVVFDESFATAYPIDTNHWFSNFGNLTTIVGIEYLNTDKVTDMNCMFNGCSKLQTLDLSTFNTSNVTDMTMMFCSCNQLTELDIRNFDTSNVTNMFFMFGSCRQLTELDLRSFDTHNVKKMDMMFQNCKNLVTIYVNDEKWNIDKVESGGGMFNGCLKLVGGQGTQFNNYQDYSPQTGILYARIDGGSDNPGYLTSKLGAYALYDGRAGIKSLTFYYDDQRDRRFGTKKYDLNVDDEPGWITDNRYIEKVVFDETFKNARPTSTYKWFNNRTALEFITGLENLNTSEVTDMGSMFSGCSNLTTLTLGKDFNTSSVTNMTMMFYGCSNLTTITVGVDWNTGSVTDSSNMFMECGKLKGGAGTGYNSSKTDKEYARIDGGSSSATPGYLTYKEPSGITTGVEPIENGKLKIENSMPLYNLQGQRVTHPAKGGIYIQNGKKRIVK